MKSVSRWREMLFRFMCYFSRDYLLGFSVCGLVLTLLNVGVPRAHPWTSSLLCHSLLAWSQRSLGSLTITHWWVQTVYVQPMNMQSSTWRFHLHAQLNPNTSTWVLFISTPSAPSPNLCPLKSSPDLCKWWLHPPCYSYDTLWNHPRLLCLSPLPFSLSANRVQSPLPVPGSSHHHF